MARTIPEPTGNDRLEADRILSASNDAKIVAQLIAEVRWLRNLQHSSPYRIQLFTDAGNSWAYFQSAYCCFQYAKLLNEMQQEFALFSGERFGSMEELEKLAKEEQ